MDDTKLTPGQKVSEALASWARIHRPPADPAYLNSLDASDFHIAIYLQNVLHVPGNLIPSVAAQNRPMMATTKTGQRE